MLPFRGAPGTLCGETEVAVDQVFNVAVRGFHAQPVAPSAGLRCQCQFAVEGLFLGIHAQLGAALPAGFEGVVVGELRFCARAGIGTVADAEVDLLFRILDHPNEYGGGLRL